ncbi:DUF2157 domain-containing protein [Paludisphaera rhizosphaerae]|uniref:DUF2157 domain-containing protein n=1 Tax=Paludisphaera rhizosphaerae TaxID=2711216 RepID=UPI0013ED3763|nr:DUF2157 domain-containing protein [Paludisphaera rhizosphaerae]
MSGREITADRRAWLAGELSAWEGLGLVDGNQAKRILGLYEGGTAEAESARRNDRASAAVMGLGGLLIGLAMFTAVAFNWSELHAWTRMALIFVVLGATYWGAWTLRRRGFVTGSNVVCFLGCLFYGAAIWLIAQTFNLNVEGVDGFWWWGVGVLPFALIVGSWPLHALVAATLAYYAGMTIFGPLATDFRSWRSFVEPAWSVPALTAVGMAWAYRHRSRAVLALYVATATVWLLGAPLIGKLDAAPIFWAGLVGSLLLLVAECHSPAWGLGIPYRFFGVVLVGGLLLPLSTYAANRAMAGELGTTATATAIESAVAVVLAAILFFIAADRDGRRSGSLASGVLASPGRWFPLAMIGLFAGMGLWNAAGGEPLLTTIAANVAMAGLAIWLTIVGAREDRGRPFAAGVAYFLLWSVSRYIDLFSGFGGMPGAALMFLACGAALVAAAVIWRRLKEAHHGTSSLNPTT